MDSMYVISNISQELMYWHVPKVPLHWKTKNEMSCLVNGNKFD
jgi:hypothetical protein